MGSETISQNRHIHEQLSLFPTSLRIISVATQEEFSIKMNTTSLHFITHVCQTKLLSGQNFEETIR